MKINIVPPMQRISGVGDVMVMGADYSMRIWLKPDIMAQYNLMPTDISAALVRAEHRGRPGAFGEQGSQTFQYSMKYRGPPCTPEEFEDIVVRANNTTVRCSTSRMWPISSLGRVTYGFHGKLNGKTVRQCHRVPDRRLKRYPDHQRLCSRLSMKCEEGPSRWSCHGRPDEQQRLPLCVDPPGDTDPYPKRSSWCSL